MTKKYYRFFNRPYSPHLTVYKVHISSLLSILHRFSGLFLLIIFIFMLIINNLLLNLGLLNFVMNISNFSVITNFIYVLFGFNFFYHWTNGTRFIFISFSKFINLQFFALFIICTITLLILLCF